MKLEPIYSQADLHVLANPRFRSGGAYPAEMAGVLDAGLFTEAWSEISQWDGYEPTPLHELTTLAGCAGVAAIYYKDEGRRFSPGSFKALGGAYAVQQLLAREAGRQLERRVSLDDVRRNRYPDAVGAITVATATDGNHGRSVAWGAARFGCRCVIYVHREVSEGRCAAMREYGADVVRVKGNYDDSVHQAQSDADDNGWFIVSDTSYPGYTELPLYVMAGYTVMLREILDTISDQPPLTHVFIQGGCGGLAAAVTAYFWWRLEDSRPRLVVVEPVQADCLYQSVSAGERRHVNITEESMMAGLSCGEVSTLAWDIVGVGVNDFVSMNDDLVAPTMQLLARGIEGARPIVAGESAVPGLAGLLAASAHPDLWGRLGLDSDSRVLVFGTEGATDAGIYRALVGADAGA